MKIYIFILPYWEIYGFVSNNIYIEDILLFIAEVLISSSNIFTVQHVPETEKIPAEYIHLLSFVDFLEFLFKLTTGGFSA